MSKKLLVVGTMAYDAIETPYQKVDRILGGAATYIALASSKFSNRCGLVSRSGSFNERVKDIIELMRKEMKRSSFNLWRARVQGRSTKHRKNRGEDVDRFKCSRQRSITNNKVSKR